MPLYEYKCECGTHFEMVLPVSQWDSQQFCPECMKPAQKVLSPSLIKGDIPGYNCPITGKWIDGKKAHRENLAKHGCREFEPGERDEYNRRRQAEDRAFDRQVDDIVGEEVHKLSDEDKVRLNAEFSHGLDLAIERQSK